ncbi:uncharacterized protein B0H64DRAFT_385719 [Chaetomium fimeti]|uniref:Uncharacterized protein n=1 Tax=Chaetomium fimeti TaxID=1854472 RepID=A0AAE0HLD3_9PEZI|nr:hypothetical protein B0H64DRAFT_385719 [Chaetomium fimeti]
MAQASAPSPEGTAPCRASRPQLPPSGAAPTRPGQRPRHTRTPRGGAVVGGRGACSPVPVKIREGPTSRGEGQLDTPMSRATADRRQTEPTEPTDRPGSFLLLLLTGLPGHTGRRHDPAPWCVGNNNALSPTHHPPTHPLSNPPNARASFVRRSASVVRTPHIIGSHGSSLFQGLVPVCMSRTGLSLASLECPPPPSPFSKVPAFPGPGGEKAKAW